MRSAYPWMGGKFYEMKWIIPLMPKHRWYAEVFLGSGVLLLNKPIVEEEFGNDKFACLVSFWKTMRSGWMTRRLFKLMENTLDSRHDYIEYMKLNPEELSRIDRAYRFLYLVKFGFNSYMDTYYSPASHKIGKIKDFMGVWLNTAKALFTIHDRVQKVHYSNYDFAEFLDKIHPHQEKFLFLDPPYIHTHQYSKGYGKDLGFPHEYYEIMRDKLIEHNKGGTKFMITCDQRNEYFDEIDDIIIELVDRRACINKNKERETVKTKIIMNYDVLDTGSVLDDHEEEGSMIDL